MTFSEIPTKSNHKSNKDVIAYVENVVGKLDAKLSTALHKVTKELQKIHKQLSVLQKKVDDCCNDEPYGCSSHDEKPCHGGHHDHHHGHHNDCHNDCHDDHHHNDCHNCHEHSDCD